MLHPLLFPCALSLLYALFYPFKIGRVFDFLLKLFYNLFATVLVDLDDVDILVVYAPLIALFVFDLR